MSRNFRRILISTGALGAMIVAFCVSGTASAVPSYARQTGVACQGCHTVFPELTPFGRSFKLNAYTIDNLPQVQGMRSPQDYDLLLNQVPPVSFMFQTSYTKTKSAVPDSALPASDISQNGQLLFPQQASLFYAGRIAPNLGAFVQITYDSASGTFGLDNTELRYARQVPSVADGLIYGITMNNNPTVQDVWNSTPAWQTPFDQRTNVAPMPGAAAKIDGGLGGAVAGLTAYLWWRNSIYAELGLYRASPQGFARPATPTSVFGGNPGPLDSTAGGIVAGWAPYWRLAYEHQWNRNSWSVGAYGMTTKITPADSPVGGPSDRFSDAALDTQYQFIGDEQIVSVQATYIKERASLDATFAGGTGSENQSNDLKTLRIGGSYYYQRTYGAALGYFSTTGSSDAILYAPGQVTGFANNSPNSNGWIAELNYLPWQNVKLALQYTAYQKFNGASSNYDGFGRNASDNNTLYLLAWLNF